jgi:putative dimethyl sulfoxide reductase chaperone
MIPVSEMTTLLSNRTSLYSLLARLYLIEVDQPLLDQMTKLDLAVEANEPHIDDGYRRLANYLSHLNPDAVTDLAVDYARVFLSAGIENGEAAFPYESVYTSPQHLIMQEARDQVLGFYSLRDWTGPTISTSPKTTLPSSLNLWPVSARRRRTPLSPTTCRRR